MVGGVDEFQPSSMWLTIFADAMASLPILHSTTCSTLLLATFGSLFVFWGRAQMI